MSLQVRRVFYIVSTAGRHGVLRTLLSMLYPGALVCSRLQRHSFFILSILSLSTEFRCQYSATR